MAKKSGSGNKALNIVARIDGAGNVTSEVDKINGAMRSVGTAARETTQQSASLGDAFAKLTPQVSNLEGKLMGLRGSDPSGVLKNAGEALAMLPGPLGLVAGATVGLIGAFTTVKDLLMNGVNPALEQQKTAVASLADAYLALGDNATVAAARERQAMDKNFVYRKQRLDEIDKQLDEQHQKVIQAQVDELKALNARNDVYAKTTQADVLRREQAESLLRAAQAHTAEMVRQEQLLQQRLKGGEILLKQAADDLKSDDRKAEKQRTLDAAAAKAAAAAEAEQKRREAEQAAREAAAARAAAAEVATLEALRKSASDAVWAAENHSAEESAARQVELQKQLIAEQIKNAERRAEAFRLIDEKAAAEAEQRDAAAAKKRMEEQDKWLVEAGKRAAAEGPQGVEADSQVQAINARLEALRADEQRFLSLNQDTLDQYSEQYAATQAAIVAAEQAKTNRIVELNDQQAAAQAELAEQQKAYKIQVLRDNLALSKSTREACDSMSDGFSQLSQGLGVFGADQNLVVASQMTADCIKSAADAVDYTAASIANFAYGNIGTGTGLAAAAAGKWAAAAAYAKGLIDLGFSAPDRAEGDSGAAAQPQQTSSALTGQQSTGPTEINVTMQFAGQAGRLGRYLVDEINAEARTPGGARVNAGVIR